MVGIRHTLLEDYSNWVDWWWGLDIGCWRIRVTGWSGGEYHIHFRLVDDYNMVEWG